MSQFARISCITAALAVLLLGACGGDDERCLGDTNLIAPLETGARWIYRTTLSDVSADTVIRVYFDTVQVLRDTMIDGETWSLVSWDEQAWINRSDGYWIWYEYAYPPSQPYHMAKFPASGGDTYVSDFAGIVHTVTVAGIEVRVTVPWGTIETYHYQFKDTDGVIDSEHYFVPGIGRIKSSYTLETHSGPQRRIFELMSFSMPGC